MSPEWTRVPSGSHVNASSATKLNEASCLGWQGTMPCDFLGLPTLQLDVCRARTRDWVYAVIYRPAEHLTEKILFL